MKVVIEQQNNGCFPFLSSFPIWVCDFLFFLSFFHLSVFCCLHALTIKVYELLPKLSRNGEENLHSLFPLLNSFVWGVVFGNCTPSAQSEFHEYFITNISEGLFVPV